MLLPVVLVLDLVLRSPGPEPAPASPDEGCAPPCAPVEEEEAGPWTGAAALSVLWLTGNTQEFALAASGHAEYRTRDWVATISGETVLSRAATSQDADEEAVAESLSLSARGERRFTPLLGVYAHLEGGADHFSAVELHLGGEAGVAFTVLERETKHGRPLLLRFDLGIHDSRDFRRQYFDDPRDLPDVDLLGPGGRGTFYWPLDERLKFAQYAEARAAVSGESRVVFGSTSTLSSFVTGWLALNATFQVDADSAPAPGVASTDTARLLGAEVEF
jgi:hypothetical protein